MKRAYLMVAALVGTTLGIQAADKWTSSGPQSSIGRLYPNPETEADTKTEILSFTASWCTGCQIQRIHTKALERRYNVRVIDYDTDEGRALYKKHNCQSLPCIVVIVEGKLKKKFEGVTPPREIEPFAVECRKDAKTRSIKNGRSRVPGYYTS